MKKFVVATCALMVVFSFGACKKSSSNKTRTELLTSASWRQTGAEYKTGGGAWVNSFASIDDCVKDDIITFRADGTVVLDEGATKCDPSDPQVSSGMWAFQNDETVLTTSVGIAANIEVLNETTLQITFADLGSPGNTARSIYSH
jgi:hypothetical protein